MTVRGVGEHILHPAVKGVEVPEEEHVRREG